MLPSPSRAQTTQDRVYTGLYMLSLPLIIGNTLTDVGVVASLASGQPVSRGWSVTGLVLSGINTSLATLYLMGAVDARLYGSGSSGWVVASGVYLLYGLASTGISIYGITRGPPRVERDRNDDDGYEEDDDDDDDEEDDDRPRRRRKRRRFNPEHETGIQDFQLAPSVVSTPQSGASPGLVLSFRW